MGRVRVSFIGLGPLTEANMYNVTTSINRLCKAVSITVSINKK